MLTLHPVEGLVDKNGRFRLSGSTGRFDIVSDRSPIRPGLVLLSYKLESDDGPVPIWLRGKQSEELPLPYRTGNVKILIELPWAPAALLIGRIHPSHSFAIRDFKITGASPAQRACHAMGKRLLPVSRAVRDWLFPMLRDPKLLRPKLRHLTWLLSSPAGWNRLRDRLLSYRSSGADYPEWIANHDMLGEADLKAITAHVDRLAERPLISILMPVYNPPTSFLCQALESVLGQLYPHWELCIADDASTKPEVAETLARYAARDARIKVMRRERNGNISAASNSALELASGPFVALMDHDDILPTHALYLVAVELNRFPEIDILYSDEDKIDEGNVRYGAYFKSDWNPDLMCGHNMISHLGVYRRSLLETIGGFRLGYEGSQDYDLALRAVDATRPDRIRHIPSILYHWRVFSQSASFSTTDLPRATTAARRAVQDHLDRQGRGGVAVAAPGLENYTRVRYPLPEALPLVSLVVPTRDKAELLRQCVTGLLNETDYPNLEILIVDNGSREAATLGYFAELAGDARVRVLPFDRKFNYSAINNFAMAQASGSIVGLINNDIKVIEPGWLKEMVSHALRPEVGAVGAKLLYADGRIQHAGVITGIHGVAKHAHKLLPRDCLGYSGRLKLTQEFSAVTAACMVLRKEIYDEVGGLDEQNLAVSFNDVDFCLRIRERGHLIVWTPYAELFHLESVSRGIDTDSRHLERFTREVTYMKTRWGEALLRDPYYNPNLTLDDTNFGLAFPPRLSRPWLERAEKEAVAEGAVPAMGPLRA